MPNARAGSPWRVGRLGLLGVLWAALVEGHPGGLLLGVVVVPLVSWGSLALDPPGRPRLHPVRLLGLLGGCAWELVGQGRAVVRQALYPVRREAPGMLSLRSRLPRGPARLLLQGLVSLRPGLHAVEHLGPVEGADRLTLHLLDAGPEAKATALARVRALEGRVARVFGLPAPLRGVS